MNINYTSLLEEVLPFLAADPSEPVTLAAIRYAVTTFCAGSWAWQFVGDPLDVSAGEAVCDVEIPPGSELVAVLSVSLDGKVLIPRSLDWLNSEYPNWQALQGEPRYFTQSDAGRVVLVPTPTSHRPGALSMTRVLQPAASSSSFPQWIFEKYRYALADGALSRLLCMPGRPWSDVREGSVRRDRFERAIADARAAAVGAFSRAPLRTRPHY